MNLEHIYSAKCLERAFCEVHIQDTGYNIVISRQIASTGQPTQMLRTQGLVALDKHAKK